MTKTKTKQRVVDENDLVPADLADGHDYLTVAEFGRWQYDLGNEYGEETGLKMAANIMKDRSLELFGKEQDAEARKFRELAKELNKIAEDRREAQVAGRKARLEHIETIFKSNNKI